MGNTKKYTGTNSIGANFPIQQHLVNGEMKGTEYNVCKVQHMQKRKKRLQPDKKIYHLRNIASKHGQVKIPCEHIFPLCDQSNKQDSSKSAEK